MFKATSLIGPRSGVARDAIAIKSGRCVYSEFGKADLQTKTAARRCVVLIASEVEFVAFRFVELDIDAAVLASEI